MNKDDNSGGFQQIERDALHAFREWPIWLLLRIAELKRQMRRDTESGVTS